LNSRGLKILFRLGSADNQVAVSFTIASTVAINDISDLEQVRLGPARLGHADLSMINRIYAQVVGSASEDAAEKIEKAFALGPAK
jgi:hypothetical protein